LKSKASDNIEGRKNMASCIEGRLSVNRKEMIDALDTEISRLEEARALIALSLTEATRERRGRTMSVAGRPAIVEAQRRRWVKQKIKPQAIAKVEDNVEPALPSVGLSRVEAEVTGNALSSAVETLAKAPEGSEWTT
jgi:hypothetical protein